MMYITPEGRTAFETWREAAVHHGRELRQEFLAKIYFAQLAGPSCVARLLAAQRAACDTMLASLQERADHTAQPYARAVYEFRCSQVAATSAWLDRCEQILVTPS